MHRSTHTTWCDDKQIKEYGFKPFKLNINRIKEDFEKVEKQCEGSDCEYYSKILSSSILKYLDSKKVVLWEE